MKLQELIEKINKILKNDEDYKDDKDMKVRYILSDENQQITDIICYGYEDIVSVDPKTFEVEKIAEWSYSYDNYLFYDLENGKNIMYIDNECHYDIWNTIKELYPEDINNNAGLEKYIEHCKKNRITKEYIDSKTKLDTPDILNFFQDVSFEKTRQLNNNTYICDIGYRNNESVALIEKKISNEKKEYIIAFNYEIKNNDISWGYGYYYQDDLIKAKEDFKKVLNGDNLVNTFSTNKNKKEMER